MAVGAQTLAGTDGGRLRSGRGRWCTDPWPILAMAGGDCGVASAVGAQTLSRS